MTYDMTSTLEMDKAKAMLGQNTEFFGMKKLKSFQIFWFDRDWTKIK